MRAKSRCHERSQAIPMHGPTLPPRLAAAVPSAGRGAHGAPWATTANEGPRCARRGAHRRGCPGSESNQRHADFQSAALPTELPRQVAILDLRRGSVGPTQARSGAASLNEPDSVVKWTAASSDNLWRLAVARRSYPRPVPARLTAAHRDGRRQDAPEGGRATRGWMRAASGPQCASRRARRSLDPRA